MGPVQEEANVKVTLNNEEAKREIEELNSRIEKLIQLKKKAESEGDVKGFKKISTELNKAQREAKKYERQLFDVERALKNINGASFDELKRAETALVAQTRKMNRETDEYTRKRAQLKQVSAEISRINNEQRISTGLWGRMANGFNRYFGMATAALASFAGLSMTVRSTTTAYAEHDDTMSDVMKTTRMTKDEVKELNKEFNNIDTRTSRKNLNVIAEEGGRIGIAKEEILEFVRAMDIANVALGDSFQGGTEEIANTLGKLKFLFTETKNMGVEESYLAIASAINELGAEGVASEQNIAEFTTRIGALSDVLKPSIADALALGAGFEESGIQAEIASRAYSIVLNRAATETGSFAKVMGMSKKQVEDLINTNTVDFFFAFAESLKGMNATETARTLDELKINAEGANKVIGAAANNTDRFRQLLDLSNKSFTEANSVIEEFNVKNTNAQAKLEKARKTFSDTQIELGEKLTPAYTSVISKSSLLLKVLGALVEVGYKHFRVLVSATATITAYTIATKLAVLWQTRSNKQTLLQIVSSKAHTVATNTQIAATQLWAAAQMALTGNIKGATQAMRVFNSVTKLNPIGLLVSVLTIAASAFLLFRDKSKEAASGQKELNEEVKRGNELLGQSKSLEERVSIAKNLSKEQLVSLKSDLESQVKQEEDFHATLLQKLKKRLSEDEELKTLYAKRDQDNIDKSQKQIFDAQIAFRKNQIARDLEEENKGNQKRLTVLKTHLGRVNEELKKRPTDINPDSDLSDEEIKKRIEKREAEYNKELSSIKKRHLEGKTSEDQYNADLLQAELKFLKDKLSIYNKGSKKYEEAVNQALEKQVEVDKTIKNLLLQAEKELASAKIENLHEGLQKEEATEKQRWIDEKSALEKRLIDKENLSAKEIAYNDTINKLIEQKEIEHQNRLSKIRSSGNISDLQDLVTASTPIDSNFATLELQQSFFNARQALIEAQYASEKELAENNQAALQAAEQSFNQQMYQLKSDQIDAEYALTEKRIGTAQNYVSMLASVVDEESALGKALFIFNQALAIGEVWVNIAKANAKAIAASPLTLGQPWVSANTVQGGIQTAMIAAQTVAKFTQHATGKYPVIGGDDGKVYDTNYAGRPKTGIYSGPQLGIFNENPNEPEMVVDGKTTRQLIINYPAIYRGIRQMAAGFTPQFAGGKYPSTTSQPYTPATPSFDPETLAVMREFTRAMNTIAAEGVPVSWQMFEKLRNKKERMEKGSGL